MSFSKKLEQLTKLYQQGQLSKSEFTKAQNAILQAEMATDFSPVSTSELDSASLQMKQEWEKKKGKGFSDSRYSQSTAPSFSFAFYHALLLLASGGLWMVLNWASTFQPTIATVCYVPLVVAIATVVSFFYRYEQYKTKSVYHKGNQRYSK